MANKIQVMRGTKAQMTTKGALAVGEPGYCTDTKELYIGNGSGANTRIGADPHLGSTTNAGNVYTVTTTEVIAANQKFTVKINAASTGAPSLIVSSIASTVGAAKPIVKPGGAAASVKIGIYTLFWDGTNFQLLGEGGEIGTAGAAQVLAPYTVPTDNGLVTGTIVDYSAFPKVGGAVPNDYVKAKSAKGNNGGLVAFEPESGCYKSGLNSFGYGAIYAEEPNFIPANYLKGKPMFGVDGAIPTIANNTAPTAIAYWAPGTSNNSQPKAHMQMPKGYSDGTTYLSADVPDMLPANWLKGKTMFGVDGAIPTIATANAANGDQIDAVAISYGPHSGDGIPYAYFGIKSNAYTGGANWVRYNEPSIIPSNLREGASAYGGSLIGTMKPLRTQIGDVPQFGFTSESGYNYITSVRGLPFTPFLYLTSGNFGTIVGQEQTVRMELKKWNEGVSIWFRIVAGGFDILTNEDPRMGNYHKYQVWG